MRREYVRPSTLECEKWVLTAMSREWRAAAENRRSFQASAVTAGHVLVPQVRDWARAALINCKSSARKFANPQDVVASNATSGVAPPMAADLPLGLTDAGPAVVCRAAEGSSQPRPPQADRHRARPRAVEQRRGLGESQRGDDERSCITRTVSADKHPDVPDVASKFPDRSVG